MQTRHENIRNASLKVRLDMYVLNSFLKRNLLLKITNILKPFYIIYSYVSSSWIRIATFYLLTDSLPHFVNLT